MSVTKQQAASDIRQLTGIRDRYLEYIKNEWYKDDPNIQSINKMEETVDWANNTISAIYSNISLWND